MKRSVANPSADVFALDQMLVRAKPGATSSFEEYLAARAIFTQIHDDSRWNPWVRHDRADEIDAAMAVMEEWTRAEPDFLPMTEQQIDEMLAKVGREMQAEFAADQTRQERDRKRYDPERAQARLAFLEQESLLARQNEEVEALRAGRYSSWTTERRASEVAELEAGIVRCEAEIERLASIVGDREDVVDEHGRLPHDRQPRVNQAHKAQND